MAPSFPRRTLVALVAAAWLAVGGVAAYGYVQGYEVHRGFAVVTTPAGIPRGGLHVITFHSPSVGRTDHYMVYLPPHYARQARRGRRFPVLYLLHGAPGKMTAFTNFAAIDVRANVLIAHHRIPPLIMVMPAGEQGTQDSEWANTGSGRWMDFVLDVVHDVDSRFATLADREHRGIAGDSEGGYGALNIGLQHLDLFSVIESWSGYFTQTPTGPFSGATRAELAANSPADYVGSLAPAIHRLGLRVWLLQGRTDYRGARPLISFAGALHHAGATVRYGFFPGGHDWRLWRDQTPRMLLAAGRWLDQPPAGRASFGHVGRALSNARLHRILAARRRHCLALRPGPGVHIAKKCRRYRAAHGLPD